MVVLLVVRAVSADVGDLVHRFEVPVATGDHNCSIGLTFDGRWLYYDRCEDSSIYRVDPLSGVLEDSFDTVDLEPACLAYDGTRNGIWFGTRGCEPEGMQIHFWNLDDDTVTLEFTIPAGLANPATGEDLLRLCLCDGLAFNARNPDDPDDDELWFSDDVSRNVALFGLDGSVVAGFDAAAVHPTLIREAGVGGNSGLAVGGDRLFLGNNGHGDLLVADANSDPLVLVSQFAVEEERPEDMACDQLTFDVPVIWLRNTPRAGDFPDVIAAYEIDRGSCVMGGLGTISMIDFESGGLPSSAG